MDNEQKTGKNEPAKTGPDVCPGKHEKLELAEIRDRLSDAKGAQYWRSLEELANSPDFEELLHREFPRQASEWTGGVSRRNFLKVMSASLALAGLSACTKQPLEPIVPYVRQPEEITPGKPLFFATAMPFGAYAIPVLAESHEGRPTKIEGNPQHPATLGGSDMFSQASVLTMYDPDRSQTITYLGDPRPWGQFLNAIRGPINAQRAAGGGGLRILTGAVGSPTLAAQIRDVLRAFPQAKWHQWEPVNRDNIRGAAQMTFGQPVETLYNFENAEVILSLDGDFLSSGYPGFHRYARQFAARRRPELKERMMRFYSIESTPTNTGGKADHRLPVRASDIENIARAIAAQVGVANAGAGQLSPEHQKFVSAVGKELQGKRGRAVVVAGDHQSVAVHMLSHAMNQALGAVGQTVSYAPPIEANPVNNGQSLRELVGDMWAGKVDLLMTFGVNPVYDGPADLDFAKAMQKVPLRLHHGLHADETANQSHWHVNAAHYLEMWSDARTFDGTAGIIQPLIAPLYGGKSEHEIFAVLNNQPDATGYDLVRKYWQSQVKVADFEVWWRKVLHDGFIADSAQVAITVAQRATAIPQTVPSDANAMEVIFRRDPAIYDGRFANNAWLQEMPKPMTQMTWDNPVLISVATGQKLGVKSEDVVELELQGRKVRGAIWLQPGHPDNSATVFLGYGRDRAGRVGSGVGFNAYQIRRSETPWFATGLKVTKTGEQYGFACTQGHQNMEGRALVRAATLEDFISNPGFAHEMVEAPAPGLTLYQAYEYKEHKWGMTIDQNSCIGCKTCVVACQAENNIPVVGKMEVKRGRHMHWLRVDNYHEGSPENPKTFYQPVPCMQCENAPCEVVCPVGATVHSSEGLNDMVYNRCVGTRYCSNNCPYKVRRFNFLLYQDWDTAQLKMLRNPDVTVRSRGVMEKCTYCVQRITHGRIRAEQEDRRVRDGEVLTACQQACPADAIVFGDMNDPNSRVSKLKALQRNYGLLEDLNTRPRTTYLAVVRNPNTELEPVHKNEEHALGNQPEATGKGV
ncbi:MAG TPA: TAT-variant-translocated molybdopterin oxidoreductase [Clostridia bacterium]|nr:TAT-variant-translocated molybdopterin oxidoreductase [Clostridia bacterium]